MPAAPTAFTVTSTAGDPIATLDWSHDGIDLDRFEVLKRAVGTTDPWERVYLLPAADFGAGPYSIDVVASTDTEFVVRALDADGEVST